MTPDLNALDPTKRPPQQAPQGQAANPFGAIGGAQPPSSPAPAPASPFGALGGAKPPAQFGGGFDAIGGAAQAPPAGTPPPVSPMPAQPGDAVTRATTPLPPQQVGQAPATAAVQPAAAPAAPGDPNAALSQVQGAFQQKFGRAMSPEEQQALVKYVGYTGGAVTPETLQKALGAVGQYSGNLQNPGLGAPGTPAAPGGPAPTTPQSLEAQQREQLMKLIKGEVPVSLDQNNPALAAERAAFDRANSQATGRQRLAAAERNAARGTLGTGGFDANLAGIENDAATRSTGFEAELMRNERQGQIDRLMQGLGMSQQYGATNLQGQLGRGQLGLGYLNAMLGDKHATNQLGLGRDQLGFNYTALQNQMNNQALQSILAGL
jgi:hypothetical protein